jgi:Zn-dependent protease
MQPTANDISFRLFGFPTSIQPFFWLIAAVLTGISLGPFADMPVWLAQMCLGIAGVLLSILVHELGHAFSFRYLFRTPSAIVLHGLGGATIPLQHYSRSYGLRGMAANCFLSFSGPAAGFVLAFVMIALRQVIPANHEGLVLDLCYFFFGWTAIISIVWGIFNLLPIYPMDGGHISREFFRFFFPRRGIEFSLMLSMLIAVLCAVLAFRYGSLFMTLFLVYFAYQNYQEMTFGSSR